MMISVCLVWFDINFFKTTLVMSQILRPTNALLCVFHSCLHMIVCCWANLSPLHCLWGGETSLKCKIITCRHALYICCCLDLGTFWFICVCFCVVVVEASPHYYWIWARRTQPLCWCWLSQSTRSWFIPCVRLYSPVLQRPLCLWVFCSFPSLPLFLTTTLKGVVFNVIIGTMVDEVRGRAAHNHIKGDPLVLWMFNHLWKLFFQRNVRIFEIRAITD